MISDIISLGKKIYDTSNWREVHRLIVFVGRSILHYSAIKRLMDYFQKDEILRRIINKYPFPIEQATRAFFYAGSTLNQREQIIEGHYDFLERKLKPEWVYKLGTLDANYKIWQSSEEDIDWFACISMSAGQRKEGLLAVDMAYNRITLYQIMFWLGKNRKNEDSLWIGAMQGPNVENSKDIIKDVTKRSHRYRTKNLILYMTMAVARSFGVKHIYAVSNEGYYANNHVRRDRKLKTNFGEFWEEVGGQVTADPRFFELPLVEPRKTMEEVPTRKRATYRKRYAFQDDVDAQIETALAKIMKK